MKKNQEEKRVRHGVYIMRQKGVILRKGIDCYVVKIGKSDNKEDRQYQHTSGNPYKMKCSIYLKCKNDVEIENEMKKWMKPYRTRDNSKMENMT